MRTTPSILIQVETTCPYCGKHIYSKTEVKSLEWMHFFVPCSCSMTHACEMRLVPETRIFKLEKAENQEGQA
jgi:transcription elongation factor Elf1